MRQSPLRGQASCPGPRQATSANGPSISSRIDQGIRPNTIRLSIGTEHIDDIIADLERGFAAVARG